MDIVKQLEKLGSREGRVSTSRKSLIKDCGLVDPEDVKQGDGEKEDKKEDTKKD
jgi:hypothetical protein